MGQGKVFFVGDRGDDGAERGTGGGPFPALNDGAFVRISSYELTILIFLQE